jgi:hypothetical protein
MIEADRRWEPCAVELRVRLPRVMAAAAEEVQQQDPEVLSRILEYGLMRRAIFECMVARQPAPESA